MESEGNDPPSPPMKIPQINLIECTPDKNLDKLNNEDASPSGKGLTIRVSLNDSITRKLVFMIRKNQSQVKNLKSIRGTFFTQESIILAKTETSN